ncbi:MAG TPA: formyltransferase family protein [Candidatus Binatia bacterium]|nr:formyltransferase family protein [Candidatus Binatia bacterium]
MRLSVLYGSSVANDFLVGSLAPHRPVLVVREEQPARLVLQRAWRRRRDPLRSRLDKLAFFALYGIWLQRGVDHDLRRRLGPHPPVPSGPRVADVDDALETVRDARPDLVLVTGTSILSDAWGGIDAPIVNVHLGIAPRYRGRFCWFWPILEGREEDVGVTLHLVAPRVDAGPIVLQRRVPPGSLTTRSFAEVLAAVTLLARDLCHELLADPDTLLHAATPPPAADVLARPAYLEPGLSAYLRYVRTTAG